MNTTSTEASKQFAEQTGTAVTAKKPRQRRMTRERKDQTASNDANPQPSEARSRADAAQRPTSKIGNVIALLQRKDGATLDEMVEGTGWLPHTTRAALTGLKKKGHAITKSKRGDVTCYYIGKVG